MYCRTILMNTQSKYWLSAAKLRQIKQMSLVQQGNYTALAYQSKGQKMVLIYDHRRLWRTLINILETSHIQFATLVKPSELQQFYALTSVDNFFCLLDYLTVHDAKSAKSLTLSLSQHTNLADLAYVLLKYLKSLEATGNQFNTERESYLWWLTVCNEILSQSGPLPIVLLLKEAQNYANLSRAEIKPVQALIALLESQVLVLEESTGLISLPDML